MGKKRNIIVGQSGGPTSVINSIQDDVVAQINQSENGLEQVHTVGSASNHMQKKIEFGRGLEFNRCSRHGYSMASVKVICLGAVCESSTSAGELSVLRRLTAICQSCPPAPIRRDSLSCTTSGMFPAFQINRYYPLQSITGWTDK